MSSATQRRNRRQELGKDGATSVARCRLGSSCGPFQTRLQELKFGGLTVHIASVANLEKYIDVEALLHDASAPEPPYWAYVWPGSRALARYLVEHRELVRGRVLEVGCGVGLVAVVAAGLGALSYACDRDRHAVAFTYHNARRNGVRVRAWQGDLRCLAVRCKFDLVCAADVTYDPVLQRALIGLASNVLADGGRLVCAESVRTYDRNWLAEAVHAGLSVRESELQEEDCSRIVRVRLVELSRTAVAYE